MLRIRSGLALQATPSQVNVIVIVLILSNLLFNIAANASFKVSAESSNVRGFLTWQVVGNIAGFITVLTLTGLLKYIPLHVAFPVTTGLAVIGVQVFAGKLLFGEVISLERWIGTLFIIAGILFLSGR